MIKSNFILIGISIGVLLLFIASTQYPGGTSINPNAIGYDWKTNYISDLLNPISVNGENNTARPWAIGGTLFLALSFGLFFVKFSKKIIVKSAVFVIKYLGIGATILAFFTAIPSLHDSMVTISSILTLIIFFYITVFIIKSKLHILKVCSILFLMTFYAGAYMYFTRSYLEFMPIMQKIIFIIKIVWVLVLEYFTRREDFEHIKS